MSKPAINNTLCGLFARSDAPVRLTTDYRQWMWTSANPAYARPADSRALAFCNAFQTDSRYYHWWELNFSMFDPDPAASIAAAFIEVEE